MNFIDFANICRFCLSEKDLLNVLDQNVVFKFEELTQTKLKNENSFPQRVCDDCKENLDCYHQFKEELLSCQQKLLQWITKSQSYTTTLLEESDEKANSPARDETFSNSMETKEKQCEEAVLDDPIICSECHKTFPSKISFKKHFYLVHLNLSKKCPHCEKTFKNSKTLSNHIVRHKPEKRKNCEYCDKSFFPADYKRHLRTHTKEKLHMCTQCGVQYSQAYSLTRHMKKIHEPGEPKLIVSSDKIKKKRIKSRLIYRCYIPNCSFNSDSRKTIKKHLESTHNLSIPNFESYCLECNLQFDTVGDYSVHLKTHSCHYICSICKIRFKTFQKLELHESKHEKDSSLRKFKCEKCEATFKTSGHLKQHIVFKHSNVRNFTCQFCQMKFKYNGELRAHVKIHEDIRAFKCLYCDLSFKKASSLRSHSSDIHGNNFIYICDCKKTFQYANELKSHKQQTGHVKKQETDKV